MSTLNILSGGAAQGLVGSLAPAFKAQTGFDIAGEFGAVGVMADKLRKAYAGRHRHPDRGARRQACGGTTGRSRFDPDVGLVETALAVRAGDPPVMRNGCRQPCALRLLASDAIFVPDTKSSTRGHSRCESPRSSSASPMKSPDRLRIFPNGATAMRELAASDARRPIGCTQSTEIISTEGVTLSGSLPPGCELATMYTAARHGRGPPRAQQAQNADRPA
mgnify:CR=1 FL=1